MKDETFLYETNDSIADCVDDAIRSLAMNPDEFESDMDLTGEVIDFIESLLKERNVPTCYPWIDGEHICYSTSERCANCKRPKVVFTLRDFEILEYNTGGYFLAHKGKFVRRSDSIQDLKNQILGGVTK